MKRAVSASFAVLACVLAGPAVAQLEDKPVPMDKAPFHIPVFQNDYLILLNVNIPPGRNTGYHIHYADSVSVDGHDRQVPSSWPELIEVLARHAGRCLEALTSKAVAPRIPTPSGAAAAPSTNPSTAL